MSAKTAIIDALLGGKLTSTEIAIRLFVSRQYVCWVSREIKCKPAPSVLGRPRKNCKQESLDTENTLINDSA